MDVIQMTRELGKMIQADERFIAYQNTKKANDQDEKLQELISSFNIKRVELNTEISKDDKNTEKIKELDEDIKSIYKEIMDNPNMNAFNKAKDDMDDMLSRINTIINYSANGDDPEICPDTACTGSCASCGGCN